MDKPGVLAFIRDVLGYHDRPLEFKHFVGLRCPLAPWTHARGSDSSPSAGISFSDTDRSIFNCLSCKRKGPLPYLLRQLEAFSGEEYGALIDAIETDELLGAQIPDWDAPRHREDDTLTPLDEAAFGDLYASAAGHWYLAERGIGPRTAQRLGLCIDPHDSEGEERIVFPVRGLDGALYGFTGRATNPRARIKVRDYYGLKKHLLLLGAHLMAGAGYLILVEGLFDYARLRGMGFPACACLGGITAAQAAIVKNLGLPTYFFHDNDPVNAQGFSPGLEARAKAKELLWGHVPLLKVRYPTERTIETPAGDLRAPEDPAELTKAQVIEMIETARLM